MEKEKLLGKISGEDDESSRYNTEKTEHGSCVFRCNATSHPVLAVTVAFLAFMIDAMLVTSVDPILPDMLRSIYNDTDPLYSSWQQNETGVRENGSMAAGSPGSANAYSVQIAVLVGLKPGLESIFNVAVGFLVDRFGNLIAMEIGCIFTLGATLSFSYLRSFSLLVLARVVQALGGSLSVVGAMAFLAASFPEDKSRLKATSIALCGFSVGMAGGYALGSSLYQFCSSACPFFVIGGINLLFGALRLILYSAPTKNLHTDSTTGIRQAWQLVKDPLILVGLGINFMQKFSMGVFIGTGPAWLLFTLNSQQWNIGAILGISAAFQMVSQLVAGQLVKLHRIWLYNFGAMLLLAIGMAMYPLCTSTWQVLGPDITSRIGDGILMATLNPMLCYLVDLRHNSQYGLINGLYTSSYNFALFVGPNVAGALLKLIPLKWIYWGSAVLLFVCSFASFSWRNNHKLPEHASAESGERATSNQDEHDYQENTITAVTPD